MKTESDLKSNEVHEADEITIHYYTMGISTFHSSSLQHLIANPSHGHSTSLILQRIIHDSLPRTSPLPQHLPKPTPKRLHNRTSIRPTISRLPSALQFGIQPLHCI